MRLVFDLEADGLYETATKIWCICAEDIDTGKKYEWTIDDWKYEGSIRAWWLEEVLYDVEEVELIGHNVINYDIPLLEKLAGVYFDEDRVKIFDTLVGSYLSNPDLKRPPGYNGKGGPHSLEAWGYRVGVDKPAHEEWDKFSPEMLTRCREDRRINKLAYHIIYHDLKRFPEALELEHAIARLITDQEHKGILFDSERARQYVAELSEQIWKIDEEIIPRLPKTLVKIGSVPVNHPFLKTGSYRKQTQDYLDDSYPRSLHINLVGGPFNRIRFDPFNIGSTEQVKHYLLQSGWIPDTWNYSKTTGERTSPKLEGNFNGVDGEIPRRIKERISIQKRLSIIEGWLDRLRDDGRLSPGAIPCGTNTGRMKHINVANVPKANKDKKSGELIWDTSKQKDFFGTQMRSLFIVPEGYKMVGHDAAGLELRMLAHYMDDPEFIEAILTGDIHDFNRAKAGLQFRDDAKTFIYGFLYGAGNEKLGRIVNGDARDGAELKRRFLDGLPKLKRLINRVKRASAKGYLKGLDGRQIRMRYGEDGQVLRHKALNTLLQGNGAIVMKKSCILLWEDVRREALKAYKILDMHDEGQAEVWNTDVEPYSQLAVQSIENAGKHFNLNIPLAGDVKIGNNWAETH